MNLSQTLIYYVNVKAPEFSMQGTKVGVIAAIVIVAITTMSGITVLKKRMAKD